uniref:Uncharacterized protein n=1 Tax=Anguilla anguilla TaxID=7936 RepID=A0A0E9Q5K6_ANGAN
MCTVPLQRARVIGRFWGRDSGQGRTRSPSEWAPGENVGLSGL